MTYTAPSQRETYVPKPAIELPAGAQYVYLRRVEYADRTDWLLIKPGHAERPVQNMKPGDDVLLKVTLHLCNVLKMTRFNMHMNVQHWYPDAVWVQTWQFYKYQWRSR